MQECPAWQKKKATSHRKNQFSLSVFTFCEPVPMTVLTGWSFGSLPIVMDHFRYTSPPRSHAAPPCTAALLEDCTLRGQALCEGLGVLVWAMFSLSERCLHPVLCRDALCGLPQRGQRFIWRGWWCDPRPWQSHCQGQSQHSQLQRDVWWNLGLEVCVSRSFWLLMENQF